MPHVRRTTEGRVFATVGGAQVRVHDWVDLRPPDAGIDPGLVGSAIAAFAERLADLRDELVALESCIARRGG